MGSRSRAENQPGTAQQLAEAAGRNAGRFLHRVFYTLDKISIQSKLIGMDARLPHEAAPHVKENKPSTVCVHARARTHAEPHRNGKRLAGNQT